jgi:chromosome segregation ATPase
LVASERREYGTRPSGRLRDTLGAGRQHDPTTPAKPRRPPRTEHRTRERTTAIRETTRIRERLTRLQDRLRRLRAEERVLAEQVAYLAQVADDAETRKLVSQTPLADRDWREAKQDLDRHAAQLDEARTALADLGAERDRLLDRLLDLEDDT